MPCHAIGHCVVSVLSAFFVIVLLCCVTIASVTGYQAPAASQMRAPPGSGNAYAAPPQFQTHQIHPNPATNAPNINSRGAGAVAQANHANSAQGMAIELAVDGHWKTGEAERTLDVQS